MFTVNFFVLGQNTNITLYVARGIVMYFQSGLQDHFDYPCFKRFKLSFFFKEPIEIQIE
jgi:hypothetical protein